MRDDPFTAGTLAALLIFALCFAVLFAQQQIQDQRTMLLDEDIDTNQ